MKKLLALLLVLVLGLTLVACGSPTPATEESPSAEPGEAEATPAPDGDATKTPADFETFKIGIVEVQANAESVTRREYFENYIAPAYNVEFIFSEQCSSSSDALAFIENCADAGCDAVIGYTNDDIEQMTQVCQEYGMIYVVNTVRIPSKTEGAFTGGYENFAAFGSNQAAIAELYYNWLKESASEDGSEGFVICSGLASSGNRQQTEITQACLNALQELYGMTFDEDINTITTTAAPLEATNDKGINVYIYPSIWTRVDGWHQGLTTALQTGKYGILLGSIQIYDQVGVIVAETEASINKNIKLATIATVSESLLSAFNTEDMFGNSSIDMATAKPVSLLCAAGFVQTYNMLTGYQGMTLAENGDAAELNSRLWAVTDKDMLETISHWDVDGNWIVDTGIIDSMLGIYHPELTNANLQEIIDSVTYESTLERLGE